MRKIIGAGRTTLFLQFLSESLLIFLLSLTLATGLSHRHQLAGIRRRGHSNAARRHPDRQCQMHTGRPR
ncbi:MAG TPA: hypothetical protein VHC96_05265 [Puia sp.]|nr:hypothetical protein [Puia sp.]